MKMIVSQRESHWGSYESRVKRSKDVFNHWLEEYESDIQKVIHDLDPSDSASRGGFTSHFPKVIWDWRNGLYEAVLERGLNPPRFGGDIFEYGIIFSLREWFVEEIEQGIVEVLHNREVVPNYGWKKGRNKLLREDITICVKGHQIETCHLDEEVKHRFLTKFGGDRPQPFLIIEVKTNLETSHVDNFLQQERELQEMKIDPHLVFFNKGGGPRVEARLNKNAWFVSSDHPASSLPRSDLSKFFIEVKQRVYDYQ